MVVERVEFDRKTFLLTIVINIYYTGFFVIHWIYHLDYYLLFRIVRFSVTDKINPTLFTQILTVTISRFVNVHILATNCTFTINEHLDIIL